LCVPEAWKHGGGSVWVTGSYDPELNLTYWGVGNAGPDWNNEQRPGDNLYTDPVVALDADTGTLKWAYQFTPHDEVDYDSTQVPVLADLQWQGKLRKVMLLANRNGLPYVLERSNGEFLAGKLGIPDSDMELDGVRVDRQAFAEHIDRFVVPGFVVQLVRAFVVLFGAQERGRHAVTGLRLRGSRYCTTAGKGCSTDTGKLGAEGIQSSLQTRK